MKLKKWKLLTVLLAVLMLATAATMTVYAYFSTRVYVYTNDGNKELAHLGMNLQLLFGKLDSVENDADEDYVPIDTELKIPYYSVEGGFNVYHTGATGDCPKFNPAAAWGSPENPYIIANERHLQNLSALQSVGYFDLMYIEKNFDASGTGDDATYTYNNGVSMPYFLVCTEAGTPVVIDATKIGTIRPIGSAEHPFIGVIGGAPISGSTYIDTNANKTQDPGEKTTTVSTLHNVKVQTTTDQTDVGLFGYVGYLGDEPLEPTGTDDAGKPIYATEFMGATSVLQNLLLSDVQVIVENPSITEIISKFFGKYWETDFSSSHNHRFSYTNLQSTEKPLPEENHHIGIFVGHVSYASVENINVYYSSNSIYAIDLTHTQGDTVANYHTASGILGFMYNMNADVVNQTTTTNDTTTISANCLIKMGTGTSTDDMEIPVAGSGSGTGGGLESGSGRGYVTAAEIFSQYNNVDVGQSNNELLWKYQPDSGSAVSGAILIFQKSENAYTLADGVTAVTDITNSSVTAGGNTWEKYFIRTGIGTEEDPYQFKTPAGGDITEIELIGNQINKKDVWKYEAGGDAIWHYGVRINYDGSKYTMDDGGEQVTIDVNNYPVIPSVEIATAWDADGNSTEYTTYTFENFFVVDTRTNTAVVYDLFSASTVAVTRFNRKPLDLIEGKNADGTISLCEEWMRERILGFLGAAQEATGMYYFYDGVFTFALSSLDDTITDTWENDKAPTLSLGTDSDEAWTVDSSSDNKTVAALLTPITDNATLDAAITDGKQLYISAKPNGKNSNDAFLMSLPNTTNNSENTTPAAIKGSMFQLDAGLIDTIHKGYASGQYTQVPMVPKTGADDEPMSVTADALKTRAFWGKYKILDIGRTNSGTNLATLRTQYNVAATKVADTYQYFNANTGAYVTPSGDTITEYLSWDGYFYYTYESTFETEQGSKIAGSYYVWYYWTEFTFTFYWQPKQNGAPVTLGTTTYSTERQETYASSEPTTGGWSPYSKVDFSTTFAETASAAFIQAGTAYQYTNANDNTVNISQYAKYKDPTTNTWVNVDARLLVPNASGASNWVANASAPMVNFQGEEGAVVIHGTTTATITTQGSILSVSDFSASKSYYYYDVTSDSADPKYYTSGGALMTSEQLATAKTNGWILLNRYPCYNFSDASGESYLQIINQYASKGWLSGRLSGNKYSLWSGDQNQYSILELATRGQNKNGVLVFEQNSSEEDPYCLIRYGLDATSYYVGYNYDTQSGSGSGTFSGVGTYSAIAPIKLYVYVIEGIIDMDYGVNTFVPVTKNPSLEFAADEYVLWPQTSLKQDGVYTNNGKNKVDGSTETAKMPTTNDPTYKLIPLQGDGGLNWGSANGYLLGREYGLHQKFQMKDQAGFGTMYNLLGGNWEPSGSYGNYSMLVAPIGSNEVEATIPKGCVAFRVNTNKTETVRVIVAIPTTEHYVGESTFNMDLVYDYYIGVWNVAAANTGTTFSFNKSDALEKFELPRSHTFHTEATPSSPYPNTSVPSTYTEYTTISYGGSTYRAYLNGGCFLVAYEFTVSGEGVYIIGSAHGNSNAATDKDAAMEIVHFSVSGTASAGRDGVAGSKLGSVDFVYDDGTSIVTMDKIGLTGGLTNEGASENYANYYASQALLHTNNSAQLNGVFVNINYTRISIRRYVKEVTGADSNTYGQTTITYVVGPPDSTQAEYIIVNPYMLNSDEIERTVESTTS